MGREYLRLDMRMWCVCSEVKIRMFQINANHSLNASILTGNYSNYQVSKSCQNNLQHAQGKAKQGEGNIHRVGGIYSQVWKSARG